MLKKTNIIAGLLMSPLTLYASTTYTIDDIRFDGVACTISTASTSIMSELLIGKTTEEAKEIMDNYFKMIDQKEYDEDVLDEAIAFQNVAEDLLLFSCELLSLDVV